jgi:hypothetical protein
VFSLEFYLDQDLTKKLDTGIEKNKRVAITKRFVSSLTGCFQCLRFLFPFSISQFRGNELFTSVVDF